MNDLDSHTQAHMFTIMQPLDKKGRGRQGHQMDVYKKEKRSRMQKGSWDRHFADIFTFLEVLLYKWLGSNQLLDLSGLLILFY